MGPDDLRHLERCVQLAEVAKDRGDDPFGSILVAADGTVLAERANQVRSSRNTTAHPELMLAQWAGTHLSTQSRREATMYTSGEHCPMCTAAQIWVGIGRLVFALSGERIGQLLGPDATCIDISAREMIERSNVEIVVEGPCDALAERAAALFR